MPKSPTKFKNVFTPVDIIIPFHGQYHLLGECLESIITKTLGAFYTLTLVDDCSPNKDFIVDLEKRKLKKIPLQYLRHDTHKGFGAALQTGFDNTKNNWVLFLHGDCRIEQTDWLINILLAMQNHKDNGVKLVSAKLNDGGTGAFDENVIGDSTKCKDIISEQPLPLVCALVNRQLFEHIGGFVKPYPYLGYEDEELFWRMKLKNFKQMICGSAFVHHHGGATAKELLLNHKIKNIIDNNKELFIKDIHGLYTNLNRGKVTS
jgi:GT2 family glycosyltransferase